MGSAEGIQGVDKSVSKRSLAHYVLPFSLNEGKIIARGLDSSYLSISCAV